MVDASVAEDDDSPKIKFLKRSVSSLDDIYEKSINDVQSLNKCIKRQKKTIVSSKNNE